MKINVKEDCLDVKVFDPYSKKGIFLRFLDEGLYGKFSEIYPEFFDIIVEKKKKELDDISQSRSE